MEDQHVVVGNGSQSINQGREGRRMLTQQKENLETEEQIVVPQLYLLAFGSYSSSLSYSLDSAFPASTGGTDDVVHVPR